MKYKKTTNAEKNADQLNQIVDETIQAFADEKFNIAVEGLKELAHLYKSAKVDRGTFGTMCKYIEDEAVKKHGSEFLRVKITQALRDSAKNKIVFM